MSKLVPYAQESREQITKSAINQSTSKTLWSFAKNRRFSAPKPACPYVSYIHNLSTISNRKAGFGTSKRRVFTEVSESPSSDAYNPQKQQLLTTPIFAESRHVHLKKYRTVLLTLIWLTIQSRFLVLEDMSQHRRKKGERVFRWDQRRPTIGRVRVN